VCPHRCWSLGQLGVRRCPWWSLGRVSSLPPPRTPGSQFRASPAQAGCPHPSSSWASNQTLGGGDRCRSAQDNCLTADAGEGLFWGQWRRGLTSPEVRGIPSTSEPFAPCACRPRTGQGPGTKIAVPGKDRFSPSRPRTRTVSALQSEGPPWWGKQKTQTSTNDNLSLVATTASI
jgi:hypothetical protein